MEYPTPSSPAVTAVMRANSGRDTKPEVRLRSELHRRGLRFRKHLTITAAGVRVRPDIVFPRQRVAVFVDGCFWHGCEEHGNLPRHNSEYWVAKISHNHDRDRVVTAALEASGWQVLRLWEHLPADVGAATIAAQL